MVDEMLEEEYAPPAPDKATDGESLESIAPKLVQEAVDYIEEELSPERAQLADYYDGTMDDLPHEENRSSAVSPDIRFAIQAMKPALMRIFLGPERVVEYAPRGPDDVAGAAQRTEHMNKVVLEDNPAFLEFNAMIEDSLVKQYSPLMWWHDVEMRTVHETYTGLAMEQVDLLMEDADITDVSAVQDEQGLFDVDFTRKIKHARLRYAAIPPEEFFFSEDARSLEDALVVGRRMVLRVSDLVEMGYAYEDVIDLAGEEDEDNAEELQRDPFASVPSQSDEVPKGPSSPIVYTEAYIRWDVDGDNVAEIVKTCMVGPQYEVFRTDPVEEIPYTLAMVDPRPHSLNARSIAQRLKDVQRIKTAVLRSTLDSLYEAVRPRIEANENLVNMRDLTNNELGGIVRTRGPGGLSVIKMPFVGPEALAVMEYYDRRREDDTGTSRAAAGLNPDALQSSTKAAVAATVTAAQQQTEFIARCLAETGLKPLFRGLYRLAKQHQDVPALTRIGGQFVPVDPRTWPEGDPDVTVKVAIGLGSNEDRVAVLKEIAAYQSQILQTLGPENPIVGLSEHRYVLAEIAKLSGIRDVNNVWRDPATYQPPPQDPNAKPPEDPAMALAQIEAQKVQMEAQIKQMQMQQDAAYKAAELQMKQREQATREEMERERLAIERERMLLQDDRERDKLVADIEFKAAQAQLNAQAGIDKARLQAEARSTTGGASE